MLTFYVLYIILLFVIVIVGVGLATYAWQRRRTPGATAFAALMLSMALASLSLAMLAFTNAPEAADFWGRRVRFIANTAAPALLLVFAIQYTGREKWLSLPRLALLFAIPLISLILTWGGQAHYLFLHFSTAKGGPFTFLGRTTTSGPWNLVHLTYSYLVILLSLVLLLLQVLRTKFPYRGQAFLLLIGALAASLASLPDSFMMDGPRPSFTPFGFAALGLICAWALFRYRLFEIVPIATDLIIESMEDAVLVVDARGRVADLNSAAVVLIGRAASEAVGQHVTQVLPAWSDVPEQSQGHRLRTEIVMDEGDSTRIVSLTRQPIHNHNGDFVGELGIVRDITERRRAEEALRESEEEYRLLIENLQEGVWAIDSEARTVFVNRRMAEMLAYTEEEMLGKHLFDFMDKQAVEIAELKLERRRAGMQERHDFEFLRRDGTRIYATMETSPITDDEGNYRGALAGVMDISDRRRAEEALKRRVEELAVLNRIAQTVATVTDLPHALETVVEIVANLFDAQASGISIWQRDQMEMVSWFDREAGSFPLAGQVMERPRAAALRGPLDRGQTVSFPDLQAVPLPSSLERYIHERRLGAALFAPLRARGTAFGTLSVVTGDVGRVFSPDEVSLAETIAAHVAAAIENARLYEQAQEVAVTRERNRLARDLHDSVTQTLYSVTLTAEALPRVWERHPNEAQAALKNLHRLSRGSLAEMRALLLELRPAMLREKSLSELLGQLAHATMGRTRLLVETKVEGERPLPGEVHVALYRITQEALNNVVKHAEASQATIYLDCGPKQVALSIHDDGRGFDPEAVSGQGFGMQNMADRAKGIGAEFSLQSQPGEGTLIEVVWRGRPGKPDADKL